MERTQCSLMENPSSVILQRGPTAVTFDLLTDPCLQCWEIVYSDV